MRPRDAHPTPTLPHTHRNPHRRAAQALTLGLLPVLIPRCLKAPEGVSNNGGN